MGRYPWAEVLLLEVLHIIVLYPTRQHAYRAVVLAAMIYVAVQIYRTPEVTDPLTLTYTVGFTMAFHFISTAYLLFAESTFPDHWRRVRDEVRVEADAEGLDRLPSNFPLAKKLWWMVDIAYGGRMIGWVQGPLKGIPPHPPSSRRTFLRRTFLKLIINVIIVDLTRSVFALSPAFDHRLHDPTDGPETYLAAVPLLRRVLYILPYGIKMSAVVGATHNLIALVCVGLGHSSPALWPDISGRWGAAYTLRGFWGYVRRWSPRRPLTRCVLGKRGNNGCDQCVHSIFF